MVKAVDHFFSLLFAHSNAVVVLVNSCLKKKRQQGFLVAFIRWDNPLWKEIFELPLREAETVIIDDIGQVPYVLTCLRACVVHHHSNHKSLARDMKLPAALLAS